jgi:hypothetical protein
VAPPSAPIARRAQIKENTVTRHLSRTATALLSAVMALALFTGATLGAVEAPPSDDFSFAERGLTAQASWETCGEPDGAGIIRCEATQLYVFDGRQRSNDEFGHTNASLTYLCVYHVQVALGEDGGFVEPPVTEQGCSDDPHLAVVDTLESITAVVPALQLTEAICTYDPETGEESCEAGSTRSVAVEAVVTGIGDAFADRWSSKTRSEFDGIRCTFASSGSGISREATATMTIDGATLDPTFAQLHDGKTRFSQRCS